MGRRNVSVSVVDIYGRDKSCKIIRQCLEADFVATLGSSRCCVQSASSIDGPEKRERGMTSLVCSEDLVAVPRDPIGSSPAWQSCSDRPATMPLSCQSDIAPCVTW
ncbi:MAG: hypothetical protein ACFNLW_06730 [Olsenella sp.]